MLFKMLAVVDRVAPGLALGASGKYPNPKRPHPHLLEFGGHNFIILFVLKNDTINI